MKNNLFMVSVLLLLGISTASCGQKSGETQTQSGSELTVQEFANELKRDSTIQLVDVRTWGEYMTSHLKNASWYDFYKPDFKEKIAELDKSKPVYLYCASGRRSYESMQILNSLGYTKVVHLIGGINAWNSEKMPVTRN